MKSKKIKSLIEEESEIGFGFRRKRINYRFTLFDKKDRMVFPCTFHYIGEFNSDGYLWLYYRNKWRLMDRNGLFCQKSGFERIGNYVDGICWVKRKGFWGRIDYEGNTVTPFIYQGVSSEGALLIVGEEGALGAIDGEGNLVLEMKYDKIEEVRLDEAAAYCSFTTWEHVSILCAIKDNRYLPIDSYGRPCLDEPFDEIYCEQPCGEIWGYIHDRPFKYYFDMAYIVRYEKGCSNEEKVRKVGLYNVKENRLVVPCIYDKIKCNFEHPWFDGADYLVAFREGKCVLVDRQGRETMKLEYESVIYEPFNEGEYLIPAYKDGYFGYINVFGVVKIPFRYDWAEQFENGRAKVRYLAKQDETDLYDYTKGRMNTVYIDHHGNVIEIGDIDE